MLNETLGLDDNYVLRGAGATGKQWSYGMKSVEDGWRSIQTSRGFRYIRGITLMADSPVRHAMRNMRVSASKQGFPNAVNCSHFPDCIVRKNTVFASRTTYRFHIGPQPEAGMKVK